VKKSYNYILLDWDGCLAKTLDIWLGALRKALEKRQHFFKDEEIGANFTVFEERMKARGIEDVEAMVKEADEQATQESKHVELYQDAIPVLRKLLSDNKHLALITTSRHKQIDPLLAKHHIQDLFDVVVCGDNVQNYKPHPEPIERALELLHADREDALMVGDSTSDLDSARNAGVDSVLFYPPEHIKYYSLEALKRADPTHVIEDFHELNKLV